MNKPISIINHTTVIPRDHTSYHEEFDTILLPKDNYYRITSITCKIDTTSLWNINRTNIVKYTNTSNQEVTLTVVPGYYSIIELTQALLVFTVSSNRASVNNNCLSVNLNDAPDIANILGFSQGEYNTGSTSDRPVDITNNKSIIRIFSSLNEQPFGFKTSFCDNLIHVTTGLNNICTFTDLNIPVVNKPNLDYINWSITDANNTSLSLNSSIYINFTISVYRRQ